MPRPRTFALVALASTALTAACSPAKLSDSGGGNANACSFSVAPAVPAAAPAGASRQAQAEAGALAATDQLIGKYLRGDTLVYRGTMHGTSTRGLNALTPPDTADYGMADGAVLASLDFRAGTSADWFPPQPTVTGQAAVLVVLSSALKKHVVFVQYDSAATKTAATNIGDEGQFVLLDLTCDGCAPSFFAKPGSLPFDFNASGTESVFVGVVNQGGMQTDVTIKSAYSAALTAANPCTIHAEDLALVNTTTGPNEFASWEFKLEGSELVWHAGGSFTDNVVGKCADYTPYSIDVAVKANDLGSVTTRNYHEGTPTRQCGG